MSPVGSDRTAAESAYTQMLAAPESCAAGLLGCLPAGAQPDEIRLMAAVMLRQLLDHARGHWARMSPQGRAATRTGLLQLLFAETMPVVANRIAHCVAQSAAAEPWSDLLQTVCGAIGTGAEQARTALFVLEQLPDYAPKLMASNASNLLPVYSGALASAELNFRISGLKATAAVLMALPSDKERAPFMPLVQPALAALAAALQSGHEVEAQEVMTSLVSVAQHAVDFFRADLPQVVDAMLQVANEDSLEFETKERALELLVTLCQQSPARVRRCPNVLSIVTVCFAFMCRLEDQDDGEWVGGEYSSDEYCDDEEEYMAGDEALEHTIEALGKGLLPTVLALIPAHVQDPDWRRRRAAHSAIAAAASAATKALKPQLGECSRALVAGLSDAHPRVRFSATTAVATLCEVYSGEFQKASHAQVLPALGAIVGDGSQCQRTRGHAAACVINFCNPEVDDASEFVEPHLDTLLGALCNCFAPGSPSSVQEEALGAVTCVAQVTETDFTRFYSVFMPGILGILGTAPQARLRGKALQCVGIIGGAVGLEVFKDDAVQILQTLMPAMTVAPGAALPEGYFEYLAPACAQIAKALKEHFVTFLPTVLPPLLHTLGVEVECSVTEVAGREETGSVVHDEETGLQSTIVEVRGGSQIRFTMNTTKVLEKQLACQTLFEYVDALGPHLAAFIGPALEKVLPLVIFKYSEQVRNSASFACGKLFSAAVEVCKANANNQFAMPFLWPCADTLVKGLKGEQHAEPRSCMAEGLKDLLQACFESGGKSATGVLQASTVAFTGEQAEAVATALVEVAQASIERRGKKMAAFEASDELEGDQDAERLEEELEEEEELMTNLVDCVGYLLKAMRANAVPLFDRLVAPLFAPFLAPGQPPTLRHNAICLVDDLIEFGGAAAHKYIAPVMPTLIANLDAEEPYLRQASVYGILQVVKHAPRVYAEVHSQVTPKLVTMATAADAASDENELVTENVVSALGSIATGMSSGGEQASLTQLWLSKLPLREDEVEAKVVHEQLVALVEGSHPAIVADNFAHLPLVLSAFGAILEAVGESGVGEAESLVEANTRDRMVAVIKAFQAQLPGPQVANAWAALTASQQAAVQSAVTE